MTTVKKIREQTVETMTEIRKRMPFHLALMTRDIRTIVQMPDRVVLLNALMNLVEEGHMKKTTDMRWVRVIDRSERAE